MNAPWFSTTITQDQFHIVCDCSNVDHAAYEPSVHKADIWPYGDIDAYGDWSVPNASGYLGHMDVWFAKGDDAKLVIMWKKADN